MSTDHSNDPFHEQQTAGVEGLKRRLGKYELVRPLGRGGMGEVWLARDTLADVEVALKMLPPELRYNDEAQEQIRTSYQRVYKLAHSSICGVKDLVLDPGAGFFLVMDYFDGVTLSRYRTLYVTEHGTFPLGEAVRVLTPVAEALDYAHSVGIAHRDIKPTNILASRDGRQVRVIDFQVAAEIRATVSRFTKLSVDTSGTYPYMAPEQFRGQRATARTDLYALAMVAYELLAGQLPFEVHSWDQWKSMINDEAVAFPAIDQLSDACQKALEAGLARDPINRPNRCVEYVASLMRAAVDVRADHGSATSSRSSSSARLATPESSDRRNAPLAMAVPVVTDQPRQTDRILPQRPTAKESQGSGNNRSPAHIAMFNRRAIAAILAMTAIVIAFGLWSVFGNRASEPELVSKSTGLKLILIPEGTFTMGSPASEAERSGDEGPQHSVRISRPFYMGVYEVTQGEYESVMGTNPSRFSKSGTERSNVSGLDTSKFPVETVSWFDAVEFCNKLSAQDGLQSYYILSNVEREGGSIKSASVSVSRAASAPGLSGYRLPTEAEWEYACRGNTTRPFHFGSALNGDQANVEGAYPYGRTTKGKNLNRPTTVGSYVKNDFGLYDMHGNVWEWCFDVYDGSAYGKRSGTTPDPIVTHGSEDRVLRGGSWHDLAWSTRAAYRDRDAPVNRDFYSGFRVVR